MAIKSRKINKMNLRLDFIVFRFRVLPNVYPEAGYMPRPMDPRPAASFM